MDYWIYENWTATSKAKVHKGTCPYCNHGEGTNKPKREKTPTGSGMVRIPASTRPMLPLSELVDP